MMNTGYSFLVLFLIFYPSAIIASGTQALPEMHHRVGLLIPGLMHTEMDLELGSDNELICRSCHGIDNIEELTIDDIDTTDAKFLKAGPYQKLSEFCYQCHDRKKAERDNIHIQLTPTGEMNEQKCLYCHTEKLDSKLDSKIEGQKLRLAGSKLCYGCHLRTPHLNALVHQVKPTKKITKTLADYQSKGGRVLPLSADGWVTCVTCHQPHQSGVLSKSLVSDDLERGTTYSNHPWSVVYREDKRERLMKLDAQVYSPAPQLNYKRITQEVLLRLPAKDGSLCMACHLFEDFLDHLQ